MWTLTKAFFKEKMKPFTAIKTTTTHNNFSQIYIAGKVTHAVRDFELFRIRSTKLKRIWLQYTD